MHTKLAEEFKRIGMVKEDGTVVVPQPIQLELTALPPLEDEILDEYPVVEDDSYPEPDVDEPEVDEHGEPIKKSHKGRGLAFTPSPMLRICMYLWLASTDIYTSTGVPYYSDKLRPGEKLRPDGKMRDFPLFYYQWKEGWREGRSWDEFKKWMLKEFDHVVNPNINQNTMATIRTQCFGPDKRIATYATDRLEHLRRKQAEEFQKQQDKLDQKAAKRKENDARLAEKLREHERSKALVDAEIARMDAEYAARRASLTALITK